MVRKKLFWILIVAVLLTATGGGYWYYHTGQAKVQAAAAAAAPTGSTATVTRGDLLITASGSGSLVPAKEVSVGFSSSGTLVEMLVAVGDTVEAGQVLARLDDTDAQTEVSQAQMSLRQAELSLSDLRAGADAAELASAQGSLASAKASLASLTSPADSQEVVAARQTLKSAQDELADLLAGPDEDTIKSAKADLKLAEIDLQAAQAAYDQVAWKPDVAMSDQAIALQQATLAYKKAEVTYNQAVADATPEELASARASVASAQAALNALLAEPDPDEISAAQAQVDQAQAELDSLLAGASASELETAQLSVDEAQLTLDSAQRALDATQLVAPIAGTVTAIDANVGEAVGTSTIITLADLQEPQIEFWVEESDLTSVAPGNAVNITFDALPDYVYPGKILSIDPTVVTVSNTPAIQVMASIDLSAHPMELLSGMNAAVEVVAGQATNALLVPVDALLEIADGQYAVFVVQPDGQLEMRPVDIGLKDLVYAEVLSGVEEGETVSIPTSSGGSTTTSTQTQNAIEGGFMMPGDGMPPMGGGQP